LTRGPLLASEARPARDPRAVDPIAAALGGDRANWPEPSRTTSTSELIVTPGTPTGLERSGPSDPTDRD
jgi:hypothetical protein